MNTPRKKRKRAGHQTAPLPFEPQQSPTQLVEGFSNQEEQAAYLQMAGRLKQAVRRLLPHHATALIVSKGDARLLKLAIRRSWHFPQDEDGQYAGHFPATSADAIAHIQRLRAEGADHLIFPATALWWLNH